MKTSQTAACAVSLMLLAAPAVAQTPSVSAVSPAAAYNSTATTITITGSGFVATPSVTLSSGASAVAVTSVTFVDSGRLTGSVPANLLEGVYDVSVTNPDTQAATLAAGFRVQSARSGLLGPALPTGAPQNGSGKMPLFFIGNGFAYFLTQFPVQIVRATVQADGSFANLQTYAGPSQLAVSNTAASDGRFIWIVSTVDTSTCASACRVAWAAINTDGSVGSWNFVALPDPEWRKLGSDAFVRNGYLYVVGGYGGGRAQRAPLAADGTPGAFETLEPYDEFTKESYATIVGRYLYLITRPISACNGPCSVFRTSFDAAGRLTPWVKLSSSPGTTVSGGFGSSTGFLYAVNGSSFVYAQVFADGSTSSWASQTTPFVPVIAAGDFVYSRDGGQRALFSPLSVTAVSPAFGAAAGGTVVTLTGTEFLPGASITLDGAHATEITVSSFTQLTARLPAHAAGAAPITVTNPDGRVATLANAVTFDAAAPSGSVAVNGGAAIVASRAVTLTLSATDTVSGVSAMAFSDDGVTFTAFEPYATARGWTLADSDGTRTVYVRFRDVAGNVSATATDDIVLDRRGPSGSVVVNDGAVTTVSTTVAVRVSATPATPASTVAEVSLSFDGVSWEPWTAYNGPGSTMTTTVPGGDGLKIVYARFRDSAGNISAAAAADAINLDTAVAVNSLSIDGGALYTDSTTVSLTLGATALVTEMQISNDGGFAGAAWEPYASHRSWTITNAGASVIPRTVYARFRSGATASPSATVQDDIILDTTPPSGSVALSSRGAALTLSASDDLSGVSEMAVSPTMSFIGTSWEAFATTRAWPGGSPFVKFRDRAGNVSAVVTPGGTVSPAAPFGSFDIPAANARVHGAVAFGGWALDDEAVTGVRIYRDSVAGEAPGLVLIGDAVFVDGARPDVAALFSTLPAPTRAGWGLMVLTSMLPGNGNGPYTFHAYASDAAGNSTLLGSRTVTADNASATVPFGTIDTPAQGETISGTAYLNFGWVLTPQPKSIPTDGSTITVYIDGQPIGQPTYNHRRADIAALFPGLANTDGAVGVMVLNTTLFADGLHTIGWTVTDSAGATEGIGSRYFRIRNGPALQTSATRAAVMAAQTADGSCVPALRNGHGTDGPWHPLKFDREGRAEAVASADRIEVRLCAPIEAAALQVDRENRPLPVGSSLDTETGVFAWEPGAAFAGAFELVFRTADAAAPLRIRISLNRR